ncbi:MAG: hypothetical protein AAFX80_05645 [Cyanobacteria bacterium J06639_18]
MFTYQKKCTIAVLESLQKIKVLAKKLKDVGFPMNQVYLLEPREKDGLAMILDDLNIPQNCIQFYIDSLLKGDGLLTIYATRDEVNLAKTALEDKEIHNWQVYDRPIV